VEKTVELDPPVPEAAPAPAPEPEPAPAPAPEPAPAAAPEPEPAPAPAPVEEAPAPAAAAAGPSLTIEFDQGTVVFSAAPLGISFSSTVPLVVNTINADGVGDKAGVKKGWKFVKIAGESLEGKDYAAVLEILKAQSAALPKVEQPTFPSDACVMEFLDGDGRVYKIGFTKKPMGISFDGSKPIRVKKTIPGGVAEGLGVQVGWEFKSITSSALSPNTKSFTGKGYDGVLGDIKSASAGLAAA